MTDAVRDAELLARALVAVRDGADEAVALAEYQVTRDAVSLPLLTTVDRIASHQWTDAEIGEHLKRVSALMQSEVRLVAALDQDPGQLVTRHRAA